MSRAFMLLKGLVIITFCLRPQAGLGQEKKPGFGHLQFVDCVTRDDLSRTNSAQVSADGKYVYVCAYGAPNVGVCVFTRDAASGRLEHLQTIGNDSDLAGAAALRISRDGRFGLSTCFVSRSLVLFERDLAAGKLTQVHVSRDGDPNVQLEWPIDGLFSHDSRFAYVIDAKPKLRGPTITEASLSVFAVEGRQLHWIETTTGRDGCLSNARGIELHPDGTAIYVASATANTISVFQRDGETGKVSLRQVLQDEQGDVHALEGAVGVACSPDGRHLYACSGRFSGDNAVSAYEVARDKTLTVLQEFHNGAGELQRFEGGNEIVVTPDGRNVYSVAPRSCTIACFEREPWSGKLTYLETLDDGGGPRKNPETVGAAGIAVSMDGKSVYVACAYKNSLSIFRRLP